MTLPRRRSQCSEHMAKALTETLLGDPDFMIGDVPAYSYFTVLDLDSAHTAYEQIYLLEEGDRPRDFMERLGLDGRDAKR